MALALTSGNVVLVDGSEVMALTSGNVRSVASGCKWECGVGAAARCETSLQADRQGSSFLHDNCARKVS